MQVLLSRRLKMQKNITFRNLKLIEIGCFSPHLEHANNVLMICLWRSFGFISGLHQSALKIVLGGYFVRASHSLKTRILSLSFCRLHY